MTILEGGCYCGNITITLTTGEAAETMTPRACDCDFCTMHGAQWLSAPDGHLEIEIQNEAAINLFEQGSGAARFWLCQRCGVVPAVTCDIDGVRKGAVNATTLCNAKFAAPQPASPRTLEQGEKLARWDQLWAAKVTVKDCWDVGL